MVEGSFAASRSGDNEEHDAHRAALYIFISAYTSCGSELGISQPAGGIRIARGKPQFERRVRWAKAKCCHPGSTLLRPIGNHCNPQRPGPTFINSPKVRHFVLHLVSCSMVPAGHLHLRTSRGGVSRLQPQGSQSSRLCAPSRHWDSPWPCC